MRTSHLLPLVAALCLATLPGRCAETEPTEQEACEAKAAAPTEVVIIGTLERGHNTAGKYTTAELKRILLALKPSAICVEMFSEHINTDGTIKDEVLKDAYSPEIAVGNDVAKTLGVKQIAFDREDRNENREKTRYWERLRRVNDQLTKWIEKLSASDPDGLDRRTVALLEEAVKIQGLIAKHASAEVINSDVYDSVIRIKHSCMFGILAPLMGKHPAYDVAEDMRVVTEEWNERNRIMAENISRIASRFPGKRLVVTTGAEHRYMLRKLLSDKPGIVIKEFWEVLP